MLRLCRTLGFTVVAAAIPLATQAQPAASPPEMRAHVRPVPDAAPETECEKQAAFHIRASTSTEARLDGVTDWPHAVALCQAEVQAHPDDPRFIYALGRAQDHLKNYSEALRDFRAAADAGHVDAMVELGRLYYLGHGVLQSYPQAFQYFSKAASAGSSRALVNVAAMTGNGQGVAKDETKALDLAEKAIEAGNPFGLRIVANSYFNGAGVPRDYKMAAQYLQQSADLGDGQAMKFLANMYEAGYLGAPDPAKASELRLQAERDDPDSPPPQPEHLAPLRQAAAAPAAHRRRYVRFVSPSYGSSMGQPMVGGIFQAPGAGATCCPPISLVCPMPLKPC